MAHPPCRAFLSPTEGSLARRQAALLIWGQTSPRHPAGMDWGEVPRDTLRCRWAGLPSVHIPTQIFPEPKKPLGTPRLVHTQKYIIISERPAPRWARRLGGDRGGSGVAAGQQAGGQGLRSWSPRARV